jgi:hypothetical protein
LQVVLFLPLGFTVDVAELPLRLTDGGREPLKRRSTRRTLDFDAIAECGVFARQVAVVVRCFLDAADAPLERLPAVVALDRDALFALVALGSPRTGVLVALNNAGAPLALPLYLCTVAIAAAVGFVLVIAVGDRYLSLVGAIDNTRLSVAVLGLLCLLVFALTGAVGVAIFAASAVVGLIPARFGARRANLMGVLLIPLILGV